MNRLMKKNQTSRLRQQRVRARIHGTADKPRLSVNISNQNIIAQIINDDSQKTLAYVSTVGNNKLTGNMTEKASAIGVAIAESAKKAKIEQVIFDRGSRLYHGRIKALAEAAREKGLKF